MSQTTDGILLYDRGPLRQYDAIPPWTWSKVQFQHYGRNGDLSHFHPQIWQTSKWSNCQFVLPEVLLPTAKWFQIVTTRFLAIGAKLSKFTPTPKCLEAKGGPGWGGVGKAPLVFNCIPPKFPHQPPNFGGPFEFRPKLDQTLGVWAPLVTGGSRCNAKCR